MRNVLNWLIRDRRPDGLGSEGERDPRLRVSLVVDRSTAEFLDGIPSETTQNERRFLYAFFSTMWSGAGDVIEIGPFLGGTTRAIAMGMSANPRNRAEAKLLTFDRFESYYPTARLAAFVRPLIDSGQLPNGLLEERAVSAPFREIFDEIHRRHDYYRRILAIDQAVPDRPADATLQGRGWLRIPEHVLTDAVFVDGCKSWFGTKYFMREVCSKARPGAYFIFQDYAWYTCFWIPAFTQLLKTYFRMIAYVDTTYVFSLNRAISREAVDNLYPDSPAALGEQSMSELFDGLIQTALARSDHFAVVRHTLQKAGALAYLGDTDQARNIIARLRKDSYSAGHEQVIAAAAISPTYSPEGQITL